MATHTMNGVMIGKAKAHEKDHAGLHHYKHFALMIGLSYVAMYILMYAMVNSFSSVFNNINQVYMAGLMAAPMAVIEIVVMRGMYPNKRLNAVIAVASVLLMGLFYLGIRQQLGVGDRQFVRSMVPHHSGAILMCNEANLSDPELKALCAEIIEGQASEINQMKKILERL